MKGAFGVIEQLLEESILNNGSATASREVSMLSAYLFANPPYFVGEADLLQILLI